MSDYKKGDWSDTWDKRYRDFILSNEKKLHKYRYFYKISKK